MTLKGPRKALSICLPGVVVSGALEGRDSFVSMGDRERDAGIRVCREDGGNGVRVRWSGLLRGAVGMRLPRNAKLGSVAAATQVCFGCVGDEVVKVYCTCMALRRVNGLHLYSTVRVCVDLYYSLTQTITEL
eukprot:GFKZ01008080.1.p1 GENE.GFKZ01008080.1~~GFKZ01008080.1.p1  ORF type:complete len:132 (-),score=8.29 GFKZ01008080.1:124-519(-)